MTAARPTPLHGRKVDNRGAHMHVPLSHPHKQRFLEWLCTPLKERDPRTMDALAEEMAITRRTLTNWKTDDKEFMEEWEKRYKKTIGSPERKQKILDVLYRTATDPDDPKHVQAAEKYMALIGEVKPSKMEVAVTRPVSTLTDEELSAIIAERAAAEMEARKTAG
jgi:protease II